MGYHPISGNQPIHQWSPTIKHAIVTMSINYMNMY